MNEIITLKREDMSTRLVEYYEKQPDHVFVLDLVPSGETTIFEMYPETEFSVSHTFATFLDDIQRITPKDGEIGITKENADAIQDFIFKVRNYKTDRDKRLIVVCKTGYTVSGAIALWAMDWLMDSDETAFNKLNPDIRPNEFLLRDLYLHPII